MSKKEAAIESLLKKQFQGVAGLLEDFVKVAQLYFAGDEKYNEMAFQVHQQEHDLDVIRRDIEKNLYGGAYLPFFREDYTHLAELIDDIANSAEDVCDHFSMEQPEFPEELKEGIIDLTKGVVDTFNSMPDVLEMLFKDMESIAEHCQRVSEKEQEVDKKEWKLINRLFVNIDIPLANKILVREFIQHIAKVSDKIEDAADWIRVMVIKRRI